MGRHEPELRTALGFSIAKSQVDRNTVMRIGAFPEVQAEKAALGNCYRHRIASALPVKANPTKSLVLSQGIDVVGVSPAPRCGSLDANADIRAFSATAFGSRLRTTRKGSVGARIDRPKRCSVNMTESASRLIRLRSARGGLNGWGIFAMKDARVLQFPNLPADGRG